jgi:hypothetical protein
MDVLILFQKPELLIIGDVKGENVVRRYGLCPAPWIIFSVDLNGSIPELSTVSRANNSSYVRFLSINRSGY